MTKTIKTKDLVKPVDSDCVMLKADCYKRGDEYYKTEPKWDRKEEVTWEEKSKWAIEQACTSISIPIPKIKFYKELEVTEDGEPVGYVSNGTIFRHLTEPEYLPWSSSVWGIVSIGVISIQTALLIGLLLTF